MLNNRRMCTRLDLLHPCQPITNKALRRQKQNCDVHTKPKQVLIGDPIWIRNFRPGKCWLPGTIKERKGKVMHKVVLEGKTIVWNRHANQLCIQSVILPILNTGNNSKNDSTRDLVSNSQNSQSESSPPMLRRSSRICKPRIPWSSST